MHNPSGCPMHVSAPFQIHITYPSRCPLHSWIQRLGCIQTPGSSLCTILVSGSFRILEKKLHELWFQLFHILFGNDVSKNTRTRMRASPIIVKPLPPFLDFQNGKIPRSHKSRRKEQNYQKKEGGEICFTWSFYGTKNAIFYRLRRKKKKNLSHLRFWRDTRAGLDHPPGPQTPQLQLQKVSVKKLLCAI